MVTQRSNHTNNGVSANLFIEREKAAIIKKHWIRLTRSCNNRCLFCLDQEAQNDSVIPFDQVKKDLLKGRRKGAVRAVLSGGEPTLHPKLPDIIILAKKLGYSHIQVITNGRMFAYQDFLRKCLAAGLNETTFSVHGHTEKLHDELTNAPGSFRQTILALKNALMAKNLIVSVDIVINKKNIRYLKNILRFLIHLGIKEFDLLQVMPYGRAWDHHKELFYDINQEMPHLKKAFSLSLKPGLFIWTNRFPAEFLEGFEHLIQSPSKLEDEIHGRIKMFGDLIKTGAPLECAGRRCTYCFLKSFCADLVEYKNKGTLVAKTNRCLSERPKNKFYSSKTIHVGSFLDFFIENRYFLKGTACRTCAEDADCDGFPINYVRQQGFNKPDAGHKNMPYELIRLGLDCNANCLFCNVPPETYHEKELSFQKAKEKIRQLTQANKNARLSLSGGEPTLRKDLTKIIRWSLDNGAGTIELQTNGIRLADMNYVKTLKNAGLSKVFMALHSCIPEVHDTLMGKKGSFDDCVMGAKNALACGLEVNFNYVVTSINQASLPDFIEFLHMNFPQVRSLSLSVVQPRGRAWVNREIVPRYGSLAPFVKKALAIAKKNKLIVNNPYCGLPLCIGGWHEYLPQCVEYCENDLRIRQGDRPNTLSKDKIKPVSCSRCKMFDYCNGVWKEYAAIFPLDDLKPIES